MMDWTTLRALGAALAVAAFSPAMTAQAAPETAPAATAKIAPPPSKAQKTLDRGIAAYKKNALARAVGAFSSALSSGGLDTSGTARALYYRGLAYRRQGRTALAITDLTNALWLNNGLDAAERADAIANRAAAYKAAGIADPGAPQAAAAAPATTTASAPASTPPAPPTLSAMPQPATRPTTTAAIAPPAAPAPETSSTGSNPLAGVGSFFSNLFSGGSSSQQATPPATSPSEVTTASTGAASATSSWNSNTQVDSAAHAPKAASRASRQRTAALPGGSAKTDAAPAAAAPRKGKYKLQLAAVRSRSEAEQLAQRFSAQYGAKIGGRTPAIEEAVFGNMGTFYRVNIGPYASAAEPDNLCKSVRGAGYDCLVVTH